MLGNGSPTATFIPPNLSPKGQAARLSKHEYGQETPSWLIHMANHPSPDMPVIPQKSHAWIQYIKKAAKNIAAMMF